VSIPAGTFDMGDFSDGDYDAAQIFASSGTRVGDF